MKPIETDLMLKYRYLSNLFSFKGDLYYTDTIADPENNDYLQSLHKLSVKDGKDEVIYGPIKRINSFVLNDTLLISKKGEEGKVETLYVTLEDGQEKECLRIPMGVFDLKDLNEDYYLLQGQTDLRCPDFYKLSKEERDAFIEETKKESDYLVLDEYPFFFNGIGFINGMRNSLFTYNKKNGEIRRITPKTMDVENVEVKDGKIFFLANDYESMKGMFSSIYRYDPKEDKIEVLYQNEKAFIRRIFFVKVIIHVAAESCCHKCSFKGYILYIIFSGFCILFKCHINMYSIRIVEIICIDVYILGTCTGHNDLSITAL